MYLKQARRESVGWIQLAQDIVQWWDVVKYFVHKKLKSSG
jgi:hypothetical protein